MQTLADQDVTDAPRGFGLTAVGVAAMLVAALGTVVFAPPAVTDTSSGTACQLHVARATGWSGSDCADQARHADARG